MSNPAPGFAEDPDHAIRLRRSSDRVRVRLYDQPVADSSRTLILSESGYPDVHYLPREDVDTHRLVASDHVTYCPFKGEASYWTIRVSDGEAEDAAWSYETPYDEVAELKGYIAFYADRAEVEIPPAE